MPEHVDCRTTLALNESGPLFSCPECGTEIGIEAEDKYRVVE